jgi:hypothetical protein
MVNEEDPNESSPDERRERPLCGPGAGETDEGWDCEREDHPKHVQAIDPSDHRIIEQVLREVTRLSRLAGEEPAHVRVKESERAAIPVTRGVRVTLSIRVLMVPAVVGHPADDGPFYGERAGDGKNQPQPWRGFEASMREESVVSDRDPEPCHDLKGNKKYSVERRNSPRP